MLRKILKIAKTILKCPSLNLQTAAAACIGKIKAGVYWDYVLELPESAVAQIHEKYSLNTTVLRMATFLYTDGQDDDVFKPRDEHDRLFREEGFQDSYDRDERPSRGR